MLSSYEHAARILDVRNLHPRQVAVVINFVRQYEPGGSVYAIHQATTSLTKIGRSENVPRRLRVLERRHGTPLTLLAEAPCPCSVATVERWVHRHFQACRVVGEWFACDLTVLTPSSVFVSLVQDVHYEILRHVWHDLIVRRLVGSWVLDRDRVKSFMSF